jgi:hypothetical protein
MVLQSPQSLHNGFKLIRGSLVNLSRLDPEANLTILSTSFDVSLNGELFSAGYEFDFRTDNGLYTPEEFRMYFDPNKFEYHVFPYRLSTYSSPRK